MEQSPAGIRKLREGCWRTTITDKHGEQDEQTGAAISALADGKALIGLDRAA
jgi:hypothetical protein